MRISDWLQLIIFIAVIVLLVRPVGGWMARVFTGQPHILSSVTGPVEQKFLAVSGIAAGDEMDWKQFAVALMVFSVLGVLVVFLLQIFQQFLPLNPAGLGSVPWDLSLNTAVSFVTNTNWQAYVPEVTVSYFTQMTGLAVQNFLSAASGMAVLAAFIFAFSRRSATSIGNFWVLLIRSVMILLPFCLIISLLLVSQGVPQTFSGPVTVPLLDPVVDSSGVLVNTQTIPLGPVASQIAIKQVGTNGGGFYNANSAHPLENPTPFSNLLENLSILFIPTALCYAFGKMIGSGRKGIALLMAMTVLFLPLAGIAIWSELGGTRHSVHWGSTRIPVTSSRAGTWKARRSGSGSCLLPGSPSSPRLPPAVRSIRCMIRSCRSPGLSSSSTCSWEKWSMAAWDPGFMACSSLSSSPCSLRA